MPSLCLLYAISPHEVFSAHLSKSYQLSCNSLTSSCVSLLQTSKMSWMETIFLAIFSLLWLLSHFSVFWIVLRKSTRVDLVALSCCVNVSMPLRWAYPTDTLVTRKQEFSVKMQRNSSLGFQKVSMAVQVESLLVVPPKMSMTRNLNKGTNEVDEEAPPPPPIGFWSPDTELASLPFNSLIRFSISFLICIWSDSILDCL